MEGKLIKIKDNYQLYRLNRLSGPELVEGKLSLKNCQSIENGYDLDELANDYEKENEEYIQVDKRQRQSFIEGAKAILEILDDKKYTETDLYKVFLINSAGNNTTLRNFFEQTVLPMFQDNEWDVEIVMECVMGCQNLILNGENSVCCGDKKPKLDADGCLILKRK